MGAGCTGGGSDILAGTPGTIPAGGPGIPTGGGVENGGGAVRIVGGGCWPGPGGIPCII